MTYVQEQNVPQEANSKAFPMMLKSMALNYYYATTSVAKGPITFAGACEALKINFEGAEHKRSVLANLNAIILRSVI